MTRTRHAHKNILAVFTLEDKAGREILMGCLNAMINKHDWSLFLREPGEDFTADHVLGRKGRRYDGFIVSMPGTDGAMSALARSTVPTVLIDITDKRLARRTKAITSLWGDSIAAGRMCAQHLLGKGPFASYGFVHEMHERFYSYEREIGFRQHLKSNGIRSSAFKLTDATKPAFLRALRQWILDLPKPTALMTCSDMRAEDVINICHQAHLDVPNQVAVIGVDNDQVISRRSPISISTITPDFFRIGMLAVRALERLFEKRSENNRHHEIVTTPRPIIQRKSTDMASGAHALTENATAYIRRNAHRRIRPADVAKFIGRSRQLIDMRLRQCLGMTLHAAIETERMNLVQEELENGKKTVVQVAKDLDFTSANQLSRIYRRHFGHPISRQPHAPSD